MNIIKDINRLSFTISKQNKPNQTDADALDGIIEYVNQEKERQLNNHQLFAKLFINDMLNDTIKNDGNYQKSLDTLRMVFKIDLQEHINNFNSHINQLRLENQIKDKVDIDKINFITWTKEETQERLTELITDLIEDYG